MESNKNNNLNIMNDDRFFEEDLDKIDSVEKEILGSNDETDDAILFSRKRKRYIINSDSDSDSELLNTTNVTNEVSHKWFEPKGRQQSIIPFTEIPGVKFPYSRMLAQGAPGDFYELLISDELFDKIVVETNLFAEQSISKGKKRFSRSHSWKPTDRQEMKKFFGLLLYMGLVRLPKLSHYWSKDEILRQHFARTIMSRNRFELLLQYLHFSNNENVDPNDRIGKIRELVDDLNNNFKKYYTPHEYLCVDESMVPFRGRLIMLQFNKQKRHKYGIKLFKVCTIPGYTYKLQIYCGKNKDTINNSPTNIVLSLCEELLNKGHSIATDNWYTSCQLAYELLKNHTHLFGTVKKNRRGLPKKVIDTKLRRGEFVAQENNDGILVLKWKDKRDVLMLSTKHSTEFATTTKKRKSITKPKVVLDYNKAKAAVDMSDQMTSYSSPLRKTVKWYKKLAIELILNTSVVNSFIMFRETTKKKVP